jgi:hypothetical protein
MNAATLECAPSGVTWDDIPWGIVQRQVRRLQARIVKAKHKKQKYVVAGCRKMLLRGLSRVDRKTHARFLGGWAWVTASGYPTV